MLGMLFRHARANVVAHVALFFAMSGAAVAAGGALKHGDAAGGALAGTYPNPVLAAGAVGSAEVADDSLAGADVDESTLGRVPAAQDAATLAGTPASGFLRDGQAAGGDLQGTLPSPTLRPGAVTGDHVADGSLATTDLGVAVAIDDFDPPSLAPQDCRKLLLDADPPLAVRDADIILVDQPLGRSVVIGGAKLVTTPGSGDFDLQVEVCNPTAQPIDLEAGDAWQYHALF